MLTAVRTRIVAFVVDLLWMQVASTLATPVVLCAASERTEVTGSEELLCTCDHEPGAMCPMHKPKPAPDHAPRWCPGCEPQGAALVVAFFSPGTLPETRHVVDRTLRSERFDPAPTFAISDFVPPPLSPPPRV